MTGWLLAGCALLLSGRAPHPGRSPGTGRHTSDAVGRQTPVGGNRRRPLPALVGLAVAAAVGLVGGRIGLLLALPVGAAAVPIAGRLLSRVVAEPAPAALVIDLLAAVLTAGAPPDVAIAEVCDVVSRSGSTSLAETVPPLQRVGRLLQLGTEPARAWTALAEVDGWGVVAAAGRRCAESGARLAGALSEVAAELRAHDRERAVARAERLGVWTLLPLGCCFLPAFVCLGIAPVVVGMAGQLLSASP